MSIALIGFMEEEVAAGRMDPKAAFEMLAANTVEELEMHERQYVEAITLLKQAGIRTCELKLAAMDAKEREASLLRTIFQTWSYLGRYTSDSDDATHAKRLLQNCLLVRGTEDMKAAVKKRMIGPKRGRRGIVTILALSYGFFGFSLWLIIVEMPTRPMWAAFWVLLAYAYAYHVADYTQRWEARHVQA